MTRSLGVDANSSIARAIRTKGIFIVPKLANIIAIYQKRPNP